MNEAILLILADAFDCSANEAEAARLTGRDSPGYARWEAYKAGQREAYNDVARRLRRIVEGGTGVHAPSDV